MPRKPRGSIVSKPAMAEVRARPVIEVPFVSCPLCSMSRKLDRTGGWAKLRGKLDSTEAVKGRVSFSNFDLEDSLLIQIRDCSGSRGHGFPTVGGYTIEQLKGKPEFAGLLAELKQSAQRLLDKLA